MSLPTLSIKGSLRAPNGDIDLQHKLNEFVPIDYIVEWFRARQTKIGAINRILVLKSETASGKSTLLPPTLYNEFIRRSGKNIICTQPRVLTAIANVKDIAIRYKMHIGNNIGWSTKVDKMPLSSYGILSVTVGTLLLQLKSMTDEEIMNRYKFIMIDEVHERTKDVDIIVLMLKNLLLRNSNTAECPFVVLMSATINPDEFVNYFAVPLINNHIWCTGAAQKIDYNWDWNEGRILTKYIESAAELVEKISNDDSGPNTDILIFLPGVNEIAKCAKLLQTVNKKLAANKRDVLSILSINSDAVNEKNIHYRYATEVNLADQQVIINDKTYVPIRRVILSTNVSETGMTFNHLKYVIDSGLNRELEYNPVLGFSGLLTKPAPISRIIQRIGRAGRKFPGVFYPLYPKYIYDMLPKDQFPAMVTDNISDIFIDLLCEQLRTRGVINVESMGLLTDPAPDAISEMVEKLYCLGFISHISQSWANDINTMMSAQTVNIFGLTKLGTLSRIFTLIAPEIVRMILASYSWGCSQLDVISIAAWLNIKNIDIKLDKDNDILWAKIYECGLPEYMRQRNLLPKIRMLMMDEFIHGALLYNAMLYTIGDDPANYANKLHNFCTDVNLNYRECINFIQFRDDIINQMLAAGLNVFPKTPNSIRDGPKSEIVNTFTKLKYCIYDGFRNNLATLRGHEYVTKRGLTVKIPEIFSEKEGKIIGDIELLPKYICYNRLTLEKNNDIYIAGMDRISVMDGYISVDVGFDY